MAADKKMLDQFRARYGLDEKTSDVNVVRMAHEEMAPTMDPVEFGNKYFGVNPVTIPGGGGDLTALLEHTMQGLTFGLSTELASAVGASVMALQDGESWVKHYTENRKFNLDRRAATTARLGAYATMADMGGSVIGTILTGGGAGALAKAGALGAAKRGAVLGGVRGFTTSESDDLVDRAKDAVTGAAVGAALSAVPFAVGPATRGATNAAKQALTAIGTPSELAGRAAKIGLDQVAKRGGLAGKVAQKAGGLLGGAAPKAPPIKNPSAQLPLFDLPPAPPPTAPSGGGLLETLANLRQGTAGVIGEAGKAAGAVADVAAPAISPWAMAASQAAMAPQHVANTPSLPLVPTTQTKIKAAGGLMKEDELDAAEPLMAQAIGELDELEDMGLEETKALLQTVLERGIPRDASRTKESMKTFLREAIQQGL